MCVLSSFSNKIKAGTFLAGKSVAVCAIHIVIVFFFLAKITQNAVSYNVCYLSSFSNKIKARTFLAGESVTVCAVDIVPFVFMTLEETKSMNTVFIMKVVWLVFGPMFEVKGRPIAPDKCPLSVHIRQAQPRMFSTM